MLNYNVGRVIKRMTDLVWTVSGELTARSFVTRTRTMLHRKQKLIWNAPTHIKRHILCMVTNIRKS